MTKREVIKVPNAPQHGENPTAALALDLGVAIQNQFVYSRRRLLGAGE
jgi:hypothetical protein